MSIFTLPTLLTISLSLSPPLFHVDRMLETGLHDPVSSILTIRLSCLRQQSLTIYILLRDDCYLISNIHHSLSSTNSGHFLKKCFLIVDTKLVIHLLVITSNGAYRGGGIDVMHINLFSFISLLHT